MTFKGYILSTSLQLPLKYKYSHLSNHSNFAIDDRLIHISSVHPLSSSPSMVKLVRIITCSLSSISYVSSFAIPHHHNRRRITSLYADKDKELHLLTFDLDDTIFPITPVVSDANVAQLNTLQSKFGYTKACNQQIIAASKQIRTELRETNTSITYTELRKLSIKREIERVSGVSLSIIDTSIIDYTFNAWLAERHASADRNLYPQTIHALQTIRQQYPNCIIGAITNGRGNPLDMPSIATFFDFCVSGEDDGVFPQRKPEKGIYEAALRTYNDLQQGRIQEEDSTTTTFNWIHVGDDLANDVGASAACGAKAVWFKMDDEDDGEIPMWSTATKEEREKREALDQLAKEHVSASMCSLKELPDAIVQVLKK